ncbi:MAG: hypothetical protein Q9163_002843 [Psora crenata]
MPVVMGKERLKDERSRTGTRKTASTPNAAKSAEFVEDSDEMQDVEGPQSKRTVRFSESKSLGAPLLRGSTPLGSSNAKVQQLRKSKKSRSPSPNSESDAKNGSHRANGMATATVRDNDTKSSSARSDGTPKAARIKSSSKLSTIPNSILKPSSDAPATFAKKTLSGMPFEQSSGKGSGEGSTDHSSSNNINKSQDRASATESEDDEQDGNGNAPAPAHPITTPPPPYKPPSGFDIATISFAPDNKIDEVFAPSNLEGKQIWHITVPASVKFEPVKETSLQSVTEGSTILTYKDACYGFVPDAEDGIATPKTLLVPQMQDNEYRPAKASIVKSLHLQQLIEHPSHIEHSNYLSNGLSSPKVEPNKSRNQQPDGLKMRYHAFGIPGVSVSDSTIDLLGPESAEEGERAQFHPPERPRKSSPSRKRKHAEANGVVSGTPGSTSKPKRRKHQAENWSADANSSINIANTPTPSPAANQRIHNDNTTQVSPTANTPNEKESKDKKAKRKAEKHKAKSLDPFRVPRSASPVQPLGNGTSKHARSRDLRQDHHDDDDDDDLGDSQVTVGATISKHEAGPMANGEPDEDDEMADAPHIPTERYNSPTKLDAPKLTSPSVELKETQEDRARRKEEKRKRKEERKRRKEARTAG